MSDNISQQEILTVKRKLKEAENKASDYEFAFDIPAKKINTGCKTNKFNTIPITKHTIKKNTAKKLASTFIETNNFETNRIQTEKETLSDSETQKHIKNKQRLLVDASGGQSEPRNVIFCDQNQNIPSRVVDLNEVINSSTNSVEFILDPTNKDDCTLINSAESCESTAFLRR